jgi:hypothetical protein
VIGRFTGLVFAVALALVGECPPAGAQEEARSGLDLRATLTTETAGSNVLTEKPRFGSPMVAGGRGVLYPTLKFNDNWFISAALQVTTRPYYVADFTTEGYGAKGSVLQATLNYSRIGDKGSLLLRAGQMSSAFGAFLLRYDDAENALVDLPAGYGYYYAPVSILGVAGAQVDATRRNWDGRVQFANSSPANPRSVFARDQYGNWVVGAGYTIRQGFRVGASAYRGPYLYRGYRFYFTGERRPSTLPATGLGADVSWAHGHTTVYGELERFEMPYSVIPTFRQWAGYAELKRVLSPRWYAAGRYGYTNASATGQTHSVEAAAGYRPNRHLLIKAEYEAQVRDYGSIGTENIVAVQLVTTLRKSVAAR